MSRAADSSPSRRFCSVMAAKEARIFLANLLPMVAKDLAKSPSSSRRCTFKCSLTMVSMVVSPACEVGSISAISLVQSRNTCKGLRVRIAMGTVQQIATSKMIHPATPKRDTNILEGALNSSNPADMTKKLS